MFFISLMAELSPWGHRISMCFRLRAAKLPVGISSSTVFSRAWQWGFERNVIPIVWSHNVCKAFSWCAEWNSILTHGHFFSTANWYTILRNGFLSIFFHIWSFCEIFLSDHWVILFFLELTAKRVFRWSWCFHLPFVYIKEYVIWSCSSIKFTILFRQSWKFLICGSILIT